MAGVSRSLRDCAKAASKVARVWAERGTSNPWEALSRYQRFQLLDGLGDQVLPVLVGLPDIEVAPGTRPEFTDEQVRTAVEERLGDDLRGIKRRVLLEARVVVVKAALATIPPRADPDALSADESDSRIAAMRPALSPFDRSS